MGAHNSFHLHPVPNDRCGPEGFFTQDIKIHCLIVVLNTGSFLCMVPECRLCVRNNFTAASLGARNNPAKSSGPTFHGPRYSGDSAAQISHIRILVFFSRVIRTRPLNVTMYWEQPKKSLNVIEEWVYLEYWFMAVFLILHWLTTNSLNAFIHIGRQGMIWRMWCQPISECILK